MEIGCARRLRTRPLSDGENGWVDECRIRRRARFWYRYWRGRDLLGYRSRGGRRDGGDFGEIDNVRRVNRDPGFPFIGIESPNYTDTSLLA